MKTTDDLARELGFPLDELEQVAAMGNTMYFFQRSRKGTKVRVFRCPKGRLLRIQQAIRKRLLDQLPLPTTVHGWQRGHSPRTYAAQHTGQCVILNVDIKNFFPSVRSGRVCAFWESMGYGATAARLLTRLTTCDNQLPQGAPTSPALGKQMLRNLDRRLGFAAKDGLNYGSYGDEFSISGRRRVKKYKNLVCRIVRQEGYEVNPEKVKIMHCYERQEIAGIVVNKKLSLGRKEYRILRAIIHNCIVQGPESANRQGHPKFRAHLRRRVAYLQSISPRLGRHLLHELQKIQWAASTTRPTANPRGASQNPHLLPGSQNSDTARTWKLRPVLPDLACPRNCN